MPARRRSLRADDLYRLEGVSTPRISPDGRLVVFCQQVVRRKTEKKRQHLWLAATGRGPRRQFTYGPHHDSQPRWSPDGRQIAFLSNRGRKRRSQIYLIPVDGGEARPLTRMNGDFLSFAWSPDGIRLVAAFRRQDPEDEKREADPDQKRLGTRERHITRLHYKLDGVGYRPVQRSHLWLIDARTGRSSPLTGGDEFDELEPAWSPDGRTIVCVSNRHEDPDQHWGAADLYRLPADQGLLEATALEPLGTPYGPVHSPRYSPDGAWIAYLGREGESQPWRNDGLWVLPAPGGVPRNLTRAYDFCPSAPRWAPDSRLLYFLEARHGDVRLYQVDLDGGAPQPVIAGPGTVADYSLDQSGRRITYQFSTGSEPEQIWLRRDPGRSVKRRQLSRANGRWWRRIGLGEVETLWFEARDGYGLQAWIVKPPAFDPAQRYPSILEIHGGPLGQWGEAFMHEFHFLAAQGYVVYFTNPRGSRGYGEAHAAAIAGRWGTVDYQDVMDLTDVMAAREYIDPARMGVTGGSYGGYLTNWIIGQTNHFRAAVTQRSISNLASLYGSSDFNYLIGSHVADDQTPAGAMKRYWEQSPLRWADAIDTPTLIIHSEQDLRTPLEQGEQLFVALKRRGVPTELVVFPDSPHGLSRTGRTDRRIARLEHMVRWFDRYLK